MHDCSYALYMVYITTSMNLAIKPKIIEFMTMYLMLKLETFS